METVAPSKLPNAALWGWPANRTFLRPRELADLLAASSTTIVRLCQAGAFKIEPTPGHDPRRAAAWKITRKAFTIFCHERRSPSKRERDRLARHRAYKSPHPRKPRAKPLQAS